jgi:ribosome biogenesis protein UTP30
LKEDPAFPKDLKQKLHKVIRYSKLAKKYKSFESRRQLLAEYDVFLADERIVHLVPSALGSVFYKSTTKRPISVSLTGKELWGKKQKKTPLERLKPKRKEAPTVIGKPEDVGAAIETALSTIVVNLSPSTSLTVKVAYAGWPAEWVTANTNAAVERIVAKYIPGAWDGVKSLFIKGPDTAALPIYMTEEIWDEELVLNEGEAAPVPELPAKIKRKKSKKGKERLIEDVDPSAEKSTRRTRKRKLDEELVVTTRSKKTKVIVVESSVEVDAEDATEKKLVQENLIKEVAKKMKEDSNQPIVEKAKPEEKKKKRKARKAY